MEAKDVRHIRNLVSLNGAHVGVATVNVALKSVDNGPSCHKCGDTGWVSSKQQGRMERCDCFRQKRATRLTEAARVPERYRNCTLENYQTNGNSSLVTAKMTAEKFVERYPVEKVGLMFEGSIGIGKTHLAIAIIKELIQRKGIPCLFYEYRELLKSIQNSYNSEVKTTELGLLRPVFETEVLVLDELGAVKPSDWVWDTVSFILNTRYNDNRTTIVTTNLMNEAALGTGNRSVMRADTLGDRIGERMRSRLHEMCRIVQMEGDDYRQKFRKTGSR